MSELLSAEQFASGEEPCADCGNPLAPDQRYCLNCGRRRAGERVPYPALLAGRRPEELIAPPPAGPVRARPGPRLVAGAGATAAALLIALGVLIGAVLEGDPPKAAAINFPAQKAPVVNVNAGGGAPTPAASEQLSEDWPQGVSGFTVQLQALPKASTQVAAVATAKTDAEAKGAKDVGALDSDNYASLAGGNYVVYSGVYQGKDAKKKAQAAAKKLTKSFPGAKVIKVASEDPSLQAKGEKPEEKAKAVSNDALKDLEKSSGTAQQDKSRKLPDTIKLQGKPPKKDNKKPGGGSSPEVIE